MIEIRSEPLEALHEQGTLRSSFLVRTVYDVTPVGGGLGGLALAERALDAPYEKDYDATPDGDPGAWSKQFDVSGWAFFSAWHSQERVGGAVVAFDTSGVDGLDRRRDVAVLWDLRVREDCRRSGVGRRLFSAASSRALARGCSLLKVETQNINVPACRFYAANGCMLGAIHQFAYPDFPDESMLLWYRRLGSEAAHAAEGERVPDPGGASHRR